MKTNTYGLNIRGLRKAAGETKTTRGYYSGLYVQISYSPTDGQVLYDTHYSLGHNSWTQYHDPSIVFIYNASSPQTMQEIADRIYDAVKTERRE